MKEIEAGWIWNYERVAFDRIMLDPETKKVRFELSITQPQGDE